MSSPILMPTPGPRGISTETQGKTENPSDLRVGVVSAVTSQGVGVDVAEGTVFAAHLDSYSPAVGDAVALMKTQDSWLVMGRTIGPGTRAASDLTGPGPAFTGSTIGGFILNGSGALQVNAVTASTDLPKYVIDYYHPAGHHVLCKIGMNWFGSASGTAILVDVWENTIAAPVQICQYIETYGSPTSSSYRWLSFECVLPAAVYSGAPRNINVAVASQNTGTVTVGDISRRGYLILQDLGDAAFIPEK